MERHESRSFRPCSLISLGVLLLLLTSQQEYDEWVYPSFVWMHSRVRTRASLVKLFEYGNSTYSPAPGNMLIKGKFCNLAK